MYSMIKFIYLHYINIYVYMNKYTYENVLIACKHIYVHNCIVI